MSENMRFLITTNGIVCGHCGYVQLLKEDNTSLTQFHNDKCCTAEMPRLTAELSEAHDKLRDVMDSLGLVKYTATADLPLPSQRITTMIGILDEAIKDIEDFLGRVPRKSNEL